MVNVPFEPDKKNALKIIYNYQNQKMPYEQAERIKSYILEILNDMNKWNLGFLLESIRS